MKFPFFKPPHARLIPAIALALLGWAVMSITTSAQSYLSCDCGVLKSVPYPTSYPISTTGMPTDVAAAYHWFDSVARTYTPPQIDLGLTYRTSLADDTLKRALHYAYAINDYNPFLFLTMQDVDSSRYSGIKTRPLLLWSSILAHLREIAPDDTTGMVLRTLTQASYILRVKVNNISSHTDTMAAWARNGIVVQAEVLDTIKGQFLPSCTLPETSKPQVLSGEPCIEFEYRAEWFKEDAYSSRPMSADSVLGSTWMKVDSEYVVFLNTLPVGRDSNHVIATISPVMLGTSGGMYAIEGGNVKDWNNDFGFGASVPVATFLTRIQGKINEITSW
ncbi:MAG: hypothetical protein ABI876_05920 [Bacteroidota bacterium]